MSPRTSTEMDDLDLRRSVTHDPAAVQVASSSSSSGQAKKSSGSSRAPVLRNSAPDGVPTLTPFNTVATNAGSEKQKRCLTEEDAYHVLGFRFSSWKKWSILTVIFLVQLSMNFNAGVYGNAGSGMMEDFGISVGKFKLGQMLFLVMYAFGCELWAPWSEELGRKWVLQGSLFLVNLCQIPCGLAPNFATVLAFRALGGLSSAGGSVTLGMVADMWEPEKQQYAVAYVVLSSCSGAVLGPVFGGFIETYLSWHWVFWIQLMFGAVAQGLHLFVPETRSDVLLDQEARRRRKTGADANIYGPNEIRGNFWKRTSWMEMGKLMLRPYKFLATEPIVAFLSLLSGFSDALTFTGIDSYPLVLEKWGFSKIQVGLAFTPALIGYLISYLCFLPRYRCDRKLLRDNPQAFKPERRLWLLLFFVVLMPIGLFGFGFGSLGPPDVHWIVPLFFNLLVAIANFAIYMATIDYMVAAYGPFAASATGGNGFCRDLLAGIAATYTRPFYQSIGKGTKYQLAWAIWITCGIGSLLCVPVYIFYIKGDWFRKRSPYAQQLDHERAEKRDRRRKAQSDSREGSPSTSPQASRRGSMEIVSAPTV